MDDIKFDTQSGSSSLEWYALPRGLEERPKWFTDWKKGPTYKVLTRKWGSQAVADFLESYEVKIRRYIMQRGREKNVLNTEVVNLMAKGLGSNSRGPLTASNFFERVPFTPKSVRKRYPVKWKEYPPGDARNSLHATDRHMVDSYRELYNKALCYYLRYILDDELRERVSAYRLKKKDSFERRTGLTRRYQYKVVLSGGIW